MNWTRAHDTREARRSCAALRRADRASASREVGHWAKRQEVDGWHGRS